MQAVLVCALCAGVYHKMIEDKQRDVTCHTKRNFLLKIKLHLSMK